MAKLFGLTPVKAYGLVPKKVYGIPFTTAYSKSWKVGAGADDGYCMSTYLGTTDLLMYSGNFSGYSCNLYCRWQNVDIPAGAVITSAYLQFRAYYNLSTTTAKVRIYFNDVDSASNPTTVADYNSKAVTTAYVDWTYPSTTAGQAYNSPDITSIIQEIVDRGGWASGQHMMTLVKDNGSTSNIYRGWTTYDGYALYAPWLYVNYNA